MASYTCDERLILSCFTIDILDLYFSEAGINSNTAGPLDGCPVTRNGFDLLLMHKKGHILYY